MNDYGIPLSEATDPDNAHTFTVPPPRRDYAMQAANKARKQFEKDYPHDDLRSLIWRVDKLQPAPPEEAN